MNKKKSLGRGLEALLQDADAFNPSYLDKETKAKALNIKNIPLSDIETNPFQPRSDIDENSLLELASSIKNYGIIQAITVRALGYGKFQIISGERRFRAAKIAGLKEIPAFIRIANDEEMLEIALVENIQRENLNAIDIAISYKRLLEECNLTQEELAKKVGKDRSSITNYLRLLKLSPEVQLAIKRQLISMGHARALLSLDTEEQKKVLNDIIEERLSVRKTEERVRNISKKKILCKEYPDKEFKLQSIVKTKVKIKMNKKGKGEIKIIFSSEEELNAIFERLKIKNV